MITDEKEHGLVIDLSEMPYDVALCVALFGYIGMEKSKASTKPFSELRDALLVFFSREVLEQAADIIHDAGRQYMKLDS